MIGFNPDAVRCESNFVGFAADSLLPLTLSAQVSLARLLFTASQPSPNVLAWDATASASEVMSPPGPTGALPTPIDSGGTAKIGVALTFSQAGRLEFNFNTAWSALATTTYPGDISLYVLGAIDSDGLQAQYEYDWSRGRLINDGPIEVDGPSTLLLQFVISLRSPNDAPPATIAGAGRMLTMTFKPS